MNELPAMMVDIIKYFLTHHRYSILLDLVMLVVDICEIVFYHWQSGITHCALTSQSAQSDRESSSRQPAATPRQDSQ